MRREVEVENGDILNQFSDEGLRAREALYFDILPVYLAVDRSELLGDLRLGSYVAHNHRLEERDELHWDNAERDRTLEELRDLSSADGAMDAKALAMVGGPYPVRLTDEERNRLEFARWLYWLVRQIWILKTADDENLPVEQRALCQSLQVERRDLEITKNFVLTVAYYLERMCPFDHGFFSDAEIPDLRRAREIMDLYAPIAPILYALGEVNLLELGPDRFALTYPKFASRYREMYQLLTSREVLGDPKEKHFTEESIWSLDLPKPDASLLESEPQPTSILIKAVASARIKSRGRTR